LGTIALWRTRILADDLTRESRRYADIWIGEGNLRNT
jgi:hypothetical protein